MAANVGGAVLSVFQTFDLDMPELEKALSISDFNSYAYAQVIGVEVTAPREDVGK